MLPGDQRRVSVVIIIDYIIIILCHSAREGRKRGKKKGKERESVVKTERE